LKAIYLEKKGVLVEKDIRLPKPKDNQVLVKIKSVGICGSDVHYWEHGRIGKFVVNKPLILGHEAAGEITGMGKKVKGFEIGDKVVIEPGTPCWQCNYCKTGRYNMCPDIVFFATPPDDGALCEYVAHDSNMVYKIPDGLSTEAATLVEPLSVGVFAVRRVNVGLGDKVVIYGSGVIGLCCMIAAKEAGAGEVTVVDIRDDRLSLAKGMGADSVINISKDGTAKSYYDVAFECSGVPASLTDASKSVKPGGRIGLIGLGSNSTQEAPIVDFIINEQNLISIFRYANSYPTALGIIAKNKELFDKLITHRYSPDEIEKAFKTARYEPSAIKVMVKF